MRMMNLNSQPVTIYKGTTAAVCDSVVEVIDIDPLEPKDKPDTTLEHPGGPPPYIVSMLEDTNETLTTGQRNAAVGLLEKYKDIFACNKHDLGRTGIVKHTIDTKDARPIKQAFRTSMFRMNCRPNV